MHVRDWVRSLAHPDISPGRRHWPSACAESLPPLIAGSYLTRPDCSRLCIVVSDADAATQWQARLALCGVNPSELKILPTSQAGLFDDGPPERFVLSERAGALSALLSDSKTIVVTYPQALLERCASPRAFSEATFELRVGNEVTAESLVARLQHLGYEHEDPVRRPGGYVRRGGIIDLFPAGSELPTRIEFFGDEIETIRRFDPESQRTIMPADVVKVSPLRAVMPAPSNDELLEPIRRLAEDQSKSLTDDAAASLKEAVEADIGLLRKGALFDRIELYLPFIESDRNCAIEYLNSATLMLIEPAELSLISERVHADIDNALDHRASEGEALRMPSESFVLNFSCALAAENCVTVTATDEASPNEGVQPISFASTSLSAFRGNPVAFAKTLESWRSKGVRLRVATDQPTRAAQVLKQIGIPAPPIDDDSDIPFDEETPVQLLRGNLAGGFLCESAGFALITDSELFGVGRVRLPQRRFNEGIAIASVLDLTPGDFVVHIQYGIGVYRGLAQRDVDGQPREFLHIEYQSPDKLLVPTDQLDRIQKYLSPTDGSPALNRITGTDWNRALKHAKKGAEEFARDLIKIYARRATATRPSYGGDTPWQSEMEASFQWIETPSQLKAINEIKQDLISNHPMDRLVCGDVGFGKTEVAIRAAFKVAQSGKQVAVLCPTTILAEQHWETFRERLAAYPMVIKQLSRLRSVKERTESLHQLEEGKVDVIIGTHALLQSKITFKDLGLIIVDEEQRFGVKHKERLKDLRATADCLTLTATPIPRTLSMALMNIRPMSLITDPPPGRLPIRTFVRGFSEQVVREALLREMARGGQAFYIFNRVKGIYHQAETIRKLAPNARVAVAHGQMSPQELEPVMEAFYHREIDILVCTTIVESGIDNPNVNTMIVDGADRLGLAQLYQLRGRVGRSDRQAYAYLLYRSGRDLTETAFERLKALQEFSELGSGYSLAFRDLQIRGAGELLGSKQHGLMHTVGYELYVHLVNQAVHQLKDACDHGGEPEARLTPVKLENVGPEFELPAFEFPVAAFIPKEYVPAENQRLFFYKRLMEARHAAEVDEVASELDDRFGHLPAPVRNAAELVKLRIRAHEVGVRRVDGDRTKLSIYFLKGRELPMRIVNEMQRASKTLKFRPDKIEITVGDDALDSLRQALSNLSTSINAGVASTSFKA